MEWGVGLGLGLELGLGLGMLVFVGGVSWVGGLERG